MRVEHAEEMAAVLDDQSLYEYTGGKPASVEELRERYGRQVAERSAVGAQGWLNWIIHERQTDAVIGSFQATVYDVGGLTSAEIAWIVASAHQGRGYAKEAGRGMVAWLRRHGAEAVIAHIHPGHAASIGVASHLGLKATGVIVDGETRWTSSARLARPGCRIQPGRWERAARLSRDRRK